jgi:hypothetical protein
LSQQITESSKKDAIKIFLPLTIVGLSLILLAKSGLPLRTKIASYIILGFLLLSIVAENTAFGVISIGALCALMLGVEILSARRKTIEEALNLPQSKAYENNNEQKSPKPENPKITPHQLCRLEWKKFEEFCCLWLEEKGFEISGVKNSKNTLLTRVIEGRCPPKTRLVETSTASKPTGQKFKALYKNTDRPLTIKEVKEVRKSCLSTEKPILMVAGKLDGDAIAWAQDDGVQILSNKDLIDGFNSMHITKRISMAKEIWDGYQEIPTCKVCNQKMSVTKEHQNPKGNYTTKIWYCKNFDTCHQRDAFKDPPPIKEEKSYPDFSKEKNE